MTEIESRFEAALDDLGTVRNAFIGHNIDCLALHQTNYA